ncbi:MAG: hypothetical protein ACREPQ_04960 [Rhodanobacter sp.]
MGIFDFIAKRKQAAQLHEALDVIDKLTFPNGEADVQRDMKIVKSIVGDKIRDSELKAFTIKCKTLVHVSENKFDSARFVESYTHYSDNMLNRDEAYEIYKTFMREHLEQIM